VNDVALRQFGERVEGLSNLLLSDAKLVEALQVQPKFGAGAEEMGKSKSGVTGDGRFV
jgi:hypothetical protein